MVGKQGLGIVLAVVAGWMAALASVSAKLAMTAEVVHVLCLHFVTRWGDTELNLVCDSLSYILRGFCFAGILLFNAFMWTFYTKSLQFCTSTVEATITSTGSNFVISALLGFCLFGETLSILWWLGSCLILAGLLLIHKGNHENGNSKKEV